MNQQILNPFSPDFDHDDDYNFFGKPSFLFDTPIPNFEMESYNQGELASPCPSHSNSEENTANKPTSSNSNDKGANGPKCLIEISNSEKKVDHIELEEKENEKEQPTEIKLNDLKNEEALNQPKSKTEEKDNFYGLQAIKRKNRHNFEEIDEMLEGGKNTTKIEENFMAKSNKSTEVNESGEVENQEYLGRKRKIPDPDEKKVTKKEGKGRTKIGSGIEGEHTKLKEDNLMFKIKSNFNNWLLNLINSFLDEDQKLLKMNFVKFSKNINAKENLEFLKKELWEIFDSLEISSIYSKIHREQGADVNKKKIKEIMKGDKEVVKKMLKLTYGEWLDIYRFKEIEPVLINEIGEEKLNDRVVGFIKKAYSDEAKDLYKKNKDEKEATDFVSSLLVMVYNFKLWFSMKKPRKKREKQNQNDVNGNQGDKKRIILEN